MTVIRQQALHFPAQPRVPAAIRAIFLHHEHRVTLDEAARMLGWMRARLNEAIENEEIHAVEMCGGKKMIEIRELAHYAVYEWPFHVIEKALGREASLIIPPALRTRKITLRLSHSATSSCSRSWRPKTSSPSRSTSS